MVCGCSSGRGVGVVWVLPFASCYIILRVRCCVASKTSTIKGNAYTLCVIRKSETMSCTCACCYVVCHHNIVVADKNTVVIQAHLCLVWRL